jgi:hypothetical protein
VQAQPDEEGGGGGGILLRFFAEKKCWTAQCFFVGIDGHWHRAETFTEFIGYVRSEYAGVAVNVELESRIARGRTFMQLLWDGCTKGT